MSRELHDLDAHDQAELLRRREITSSELVRHHLDRIDAEEFGAFVTVTPDAAIEQATRADRLLERGDAPPFCGVPTAIKDLTATAGTRTTLGSRLLGEDVPEEDAHVVTRVQEAGFVSLGKTNTPEFGLSSFTDNDLVGPTVTPWDTTRNAGGSSGGAAAAVSARLLPVALGSDGGGSIRIPASSCGIFGLKPSRGLISAGPLGVQWNGLASDGALTRTVRDAAALLDVLAGPMPGDSRISAAPSTPFREQASRDPGPLRVARWSRPYLDFAASSPESIAAWERASELLAAAGHEIVDIDNPWAPELEAQFNVVWSAGMAAAPIPPEAEGLLRPTTRYWRERGGRASAPELAAAMGFLELTTRATLAQLAEFDLFLTPTLALPPQPTDWFTSPEDPLEIHRRELLFTPFTALMNMSGQPAASLPVYATEPSAQAPSLPIGAMLAAHPGSDGLLLAVCAQLEDAFLTTPPER
ncbi:amidase [Aeromicrobium phragmitis]|uniref:Amidase n=1 Tax=Aeromicrobium phragmitis TaxID=2478914 RepID=A0A3L8PLR1_9ACTN|nr:amidase [Aeromicrobium phragmitis]RLV56200.1 amidase [Aeromicrobium phragmitis]